MVRLFLCFSLLSYISLARAQDLRPYEHFQGKWQAEKSDGNIFDGKVNIVYVKSRAGSLSSTMLLIYDDKQRGLLCSGTEKYKELLFCEAVETAKKHISADDRADLVTREFADNLFFVVKLEKHDENLNVMGHYLTDAACLEDNSCSYQSLSVLLRE